MRLLISHSYCLISSPPLLLTCFTPCQAYAEGYPGSLPASQLVGRTVDSNGCGSSADSNPDSQSCYSSGGCFFGAFGSDSSSKYAR